MTMYVMMYLLIWTIIMIVSILKELYKWASLFPNINRLKCKACEQNKIGIKSLTYTKHSNAK